MPVKSIVDQLERRKVYRFASNKIGSTDKHFWVCLKKGDGIILLSCCTSQGSKRMKVIEKQGLPESTLVWIPNDGTNYFTKDTFVDCNQIFDFSFEEFEDKYQRGELTPSGEINEGCFEQILIGIRDSTVLSDEERSKVPTPEDFLDSLDETSSS